MSDTLVLDMSTQSEGAAAVFTKRDWLTILDNQNQNYQGNQCVIDTSQLANSNKYMNYREGYLTIPMLLTMTSATGVVPAWNTPASSPDFLIGLKNWYGSIIHSFTLDYNGTTIIQQTPYIGLWNSFKLMTSLSLDDVRTQGSLIGFYPDVAECARFATANSTYGIGTCNNTIIPQVNSTPGSSLALSLQYWTSAQSQADVAIADMGLNVGLYKRIQAWNFDPVGQAGSLANAAPYSPTLVAQTSLNTLWQSYVINHTTGGAGENSCYQVAILGIVYLKHIASFFERIPLVKGVFCKLTLNLNQTSVNFTAAGGQSGVLSAPVVTSPLGGVSPIMICDTFGGSVGALLGGAYIVSLAVGARCLNSTQLSSTTGAGIPIQSQIGGGSITLNVPAYTFNPVFEQSYLSAPIKKVVYTDVYQYQILNVSANSTFNNLVTNGIANIKSVLLLPFYTATANGGVLPIQSPFDPAGGGPTSPLVQFSQFNIQVSGQNAIYNTERYSHEQFVNQFKGVNAINGGQTDGLTSGLVGYKQWMAEYSYYYVNCGRMLPVEESVPKSVNVLGQNMSAKAIDLYVFVEYGVEVSIDILTGSRV